MNDEKGVDDTRRYWDDAASSFDDEPDHGLRDPLVRETWTNFLRASLPSKNGAILDMGCGTGSLSVVLAGLGHTVTGIDLSPAMISLARAKAETLRLPIEFQVMDATSPQFPGEQFEAIVCRHLLWTLPDRKHGLQRWARLLKQKGRFIFIEGYWGTGAGLHASEIIQILPASFTTLVQNLSDDPDFWGKEVSDERYAIIAEKKH